MPMVTIRADTMQLVRAKKPAALRFARVATRLDDGSWSIPIDDTVAVTIAQERVRGESDDGVISRLIGGNALRS